MKKLITAVFLSMTLTACGGGGGGGGGGGAQNPPPAAAQTDFQQGIFRSSAIYQAQCLNPRAGTGDAQGSTEDENNWLRAWSNDLYLWYDEIVDRDPAAFSTPEYFDLMRTFETTPSGADKDQFHFSLDTEVWEQQSQSGISASYGADLVLLSATAPRRIVAALVQDGTPAALAGIERGTVFVEVDGVDAINGTDVNTLNAGLFPAGPGETHDFVVEDFDGSNRRSVTLTSASITENTVPVAQIINTPSGPVGYLVFTAFLGPSEERLFDEIQAMANAGVVELVLDLRYNGGGFLDIANELAFMIAGPAAAQGRVFEEIRFNDKHPTTNPVTGQALTPDFFHTTAQGFSVPNGTALPTLNLSRVFILSGSRTGSASESVINGLRGIDFPVVLIGGTTVGKPFGFYATDNCGTTYFSIQFQGVNAKGFGDFADGFIPTETPVQEYEVQGCAVADDFSRALGDPDEARLTTALGYIEQGDCSAAPIVTTNPAVASGPSVPAGGSVGGGPTGTSAPALVEPPRTPGAIKTP